MSILKKGNIGKHVEAMSEFVIISIPLSNFIRLTENLLRPWTKQMKVKTRGGT